MTATPERGHRPRWRWAAAFVVLIGGPLVLYGILRLMGMPAAVVSGVVVIVAAKHLGLMALMLGPAYAALRRVRR